MILSLLCAICVVIFMSPVFLWYYTLYKYRNLKNIPGPKPLLLIGNVKDIGLTPREFLKNFARLIREYGDVIKLFIGNELHIVISDVDVIEYLLSSNVHLTKGDSYNVLHDWLGDGLLTSTGDKWRFRRKLITPTFHFKILERFMDVFNDAGMVLVEKLSEVTGKPFDIYKYITLYSLDVICETSMGTKVNAQNKQNVAYVNALDEMTHTIITRMCSFWKRYDCLYRFSSAYSKYLECLKTLHDFTSNVIQNRRSELEHIEDKITENEDNAKRKVAFIDLLLKSEPVVLKTNDIQEETDTFMFEGHDTVSSGLSFALYALSLYPDLQQKVYEEIVSVVDDVANLTLQDIQNMKYLELFIKETQRIYPSVPNIQRSLVKTDTIGGHTYRKGTIMDIFIYGLHHNEKYFPNPEVFDPERFHPEQVMKRPTYSYIPFSAGSRNCIGQKFAMIHMKSSLAKIVRLFEILPVPNKAPILEMAAVLKSENGIYVELNKRNPLVN